MFAQLFATSLALDIWYAIPLISAISLVYAATRHEEMQRILSHAWRFAIGVVVFMLIVLVVFSLFVYFGSS